MMDIVYCGNCSIDVIKIKNLEMQCFGGSSLNSALVSSLSKLKIGLLSTIGSDFKFEILKNIHFMGNKVRDKSNCFVIDEKLGTCSLVDSDYLPTPTSEGIKTKHLHISFRAGVDIEKILLSNILYQTLSIDVMKYSLEKMIPLIEKHKNKVNLIFCNREEYQMLKKLKLNNIQLVVTNEEKPIIHIGENNVESFDIPPIDFKIKSTTGAGDSFIGGFLCEWIQEQKLINCIISGVAASRLCLQTLGNYNITKSDFNKEKEKISFLINENKIPKNIVVIGNSCAGKTTFANYLRQYYPIYDDIDDYPPLKEVFDLDDYIRDNFYKLKILKYKNKIKYINPIYEEYINTFPNIHYYSSKASNGGHNIERAILWDLILKYSLQNTQSTYNIIQFSRGYDEMYVSDYGLNIYERSMKIIRNNLINFDETIIVNLISKLDIRKERNIVRFKNGGHFVAEETMEKVYRDDVTYENLCGIKVYNVYNTRQISNEFEKSQFFIYNIVDIISNYNRGGNIYGYEKNTKRNFSK